jgi:hypothetical protein
MNNFVKKPLQIVKKSFIRMLPARWHVVYRYLRAHGRMPNLKSPRTFNEKIAWRKLYDHNPRMPPLVDKIVGKEMMAARFGADFVIPTLATFASEREVDFSALPYPCVLKANHGSGMNIFLAQRPPDEMIVRLQLRRFLHCDFSWAHREWAYSQIPRRILVEPLVEGGEHGLVDYKFHTFGGKVFAIQVDLDRYTGHRRAFYDLKWKRMPFELLYPAPAYEVAPPAKLEEMLHYAEQIGKDFAHVRVDLYEIGGGVKFGEATFTHGAGHERFEPKEWDLLFGAQWKLDAGRDRP